MFGQSLLSAFGSAACTTDTDQLFPATTFQSVATYQLNGNVNDLTGNYNGTQSGGTWETNGEFLGCWNSDGVSDEYLQASQPPNVKTVSAWIKVAGTHTNGTGTIIWSNGVPSAPSVGYFLGIQNNGTVYAFGSYVGLTRTVTLNQWYHVAATLEGTTVKIYWEGTHVETRTTSYDPVNGTQITIGRSYYAANYHNFNGSIDQIRIYDKTLTSADITTLYNETVATSSTNITFEEYNGIAYYKMSDATDQLGNYNGTATNVNFNTEGKFGFAGAFNGSSSRITTNLITPNTQDLSWSFWVKDLVHNGSSSDNTLLLNYKNNYAFINYTSSNTIYANARNSSTNANVDVQSSAIDTSSWTHIVFVSSLSSGSFLYIDGALVDSNTASMPSRLSINYGSGLEIGWNPAEGSPFTSYALDGKIDQIRIYDSALSAANVTTLYNEIECPAVAVTNAFNAVLWTGDGTSSNAITGVGFEPDLVWIKSRSAAYSHRLFDSVRGATKRIMSNSTDAEAIASDELTAFGSNGFTLSNGVGVNQSSATYVAWNWKAGGADVLNEEGTIDSQVSANVNAGFSIVKSSPNLGNGQSGTLGHGLDSAPEMIITKSLDQTLNWWTSIDGITGVQDDYVALNLTNAKNNLGSSYPFGRATSSVFSISNAFISTSSSLISYCFHSVDGYSKINSYEGGTITSSNPVYLGFRPAFVMFKTTQTGNEWLIYDSVRDTSDPLQKILYPSSSAVEGVSTSDNYNLYTTSSGFYFNNTVGYLNNSASDVIFMAIA